MRVNSKRDLEKNFLCVLIDKVKRGVIIKEDRQTIQVNRKGIETKMKNKPKAKKQQRII